MNTVLPPDHGLELGGVPQRWLDGLPLGNGGIGVMCWGGQDRLCFTLDSAAAWDSRCACPEFDDPRYNYDELCELVGQGDHVTVSKVFGAPRDRANRLAPTKLYLGRLEIAYSRASCAEFALDLAEAGVGARFGGRETERRLEAFVCRDRDVVCIRLDPWPADTPIGFVPFYEAAPELAQLGHPEVVRHENGDICLALLHILPDRHFALCWNMTGPDVFVAVADADDPDTAEGLARQAHQGAVDTGFGALRRTHGEQWRDFWAASAIVLPEKESEFLWYYGLYLLACSARRGAYPPGLQGLWAMDGIAPPWRGDYHADMNVQETFWPACPSGHVELLDVWLDYALRVLPKAEAFTRGFFGTDGAFQVCSTAPEHAMLIGGWLPVCFAWSHTGWLAHLAWLRWRYSFDVDWLRRTGYPLVKSAFVFYAANLRMEDDGRYHVPLSSSPEYDNNWPSAWCKDPNIDIALIRTCCDWVREMEQALGVDDLTPRAVEVHERLTPYELVEWNEPNLPPVREALALWPGKPLDQSHRHPSHLMAIHPAMDLTIDGSPEERRIIEDSLTQFLALGQYLWAGHTYAQMVSMAAVVGKREMAYQFLRRLRDRWLLPNGLHVNREMGRAGDSRFSTSAAEVEKAPFTMEANCGVACGISDMLVQGWGDVIRLFPGTPARWQDALFVDLLTEGAFRVSAMMREGEVVWVRIRATVDRVCRLRDPFPGREFSATGARPERDGDLLVWPMRAGDVVTLGVGDVEPDFAAERARIRTAERPWIRLAGTRES